MKKLALFGMLIMTVYVNCANAAPSISWGVKGSTFEVTARNDESRGYTCVINYWLKYVNFGEPGQQRFNASYSVPPHSNGMVFLHQTSYSASTLSQSVENNNCNAWPIPSPPQSGENIERPIFACPGGLTFIGNAYAERASGGKGLLVVGEVKFPKKFKLDTSYQQTSRVPVAGGGATSTWDGISNIPKGIHIWTGGAHYWSVGIKVPGRPENGPPTLEIDGEGSPSRATMGIYCGPEGWPGPGCNVKFTVCAKEQK